MPGAAYTDAMSNYSDAVMDWLAANSELFGVPAQNWMLVIGGGLLIYIAVLVIAKRRQPRVR
jgi:hypothetical protein